MTPNRELQAGADNGNKFIIRIGLDDGVDTYYSITPQRTIAEQLDIDAESNSKVLFPSTIERKWLDV